MALAEGAVALLAVPALFSANLAGWAHQNATPGSLFKLLLPLLLVTPPATAMGLVMPWMIRALAANESSTPKQSVWLYGVNALANAWLEWDTGRNILGLRKPWFIGIPGAEYVRDAQRAGKLLLPEHFREAQEAGQFFLTLEVAARMELPTAENLKIQIPERLPYPLQSDAQAQWNQWSARVKPRTN